MMNFVATRAIRGPYNSYLVQGQDPRTFNWRTILELGAREQYAAEEIAKNYALSCSRKRPELITAYNNQGYGIGSFLKGTAYRP